MLWTCSHSVDTARVHPAAMAPCAASRPLAHLPSTHPRSSSCSTVPSSPPRSTWSVFGKRPFLLLGSPVSERNCYAALQCTLHPAPPRFTLCPHSPLCAPPHLTQHPASHSTSLTQHPNPASPRSVGQPPADHGGPLGGLPRGPLRLPRPLQRHASAGRAASCNAAGRHRVSTWAAVMSWKRWGEGASYAEPLTRAKKSLFSLPSLRLPPPLLQAAICAATKAILRPFTPVLALLTAALRTAHRATISPALAALARPTLAAAAATRRILTSALAPVASSVAGRALRAVGCRAGKAGAIVLRGHGWAARAFAAACLAAWGLAMCLWAAFCVGLSLPVEVRRTVKGDTYAIFTSISPGSSAKHRTLAAHLHNHRTCHHTLAARAHHNGTCHYTLAARLSDAGPCLRCRLQLRPRPPPLVDDTGRGER